MKLLVVRSVAIAAGLVLAALGSSAEGAASTKFGAWSLGWYDSAIPLMLRAPTLGSNPGPQFDVRQDRQYAGFCNQQSGPEGYCATLLAANGKLLQFAQANPGHHYVIGDEPDQYNVSAANYAAWYRTFTSAVLDVDPSARFSPAGFAEPNLEPSSDGHFTTYAENFYNAYLAAYDVPPPVNEWRFNLGLSPAWVPLVDGAIAWSQGRGAKVTLTIGYTGRSAQENVVPELQQFLAYVSPKTQVAHVAYFVYNPQTETPALYNHALTTPSGHLTLEGVAYMQYALAAPSSIPSASPSPDFNGDGFADFADQWRDTNQFWIHYNNGAGGFGAGVGPYAPGHPGSGFSTLAANFVGDAQADYADVHAASKQAWIHARYANGSFDPPNTSSGYANLSTGAAVDKLSAVEILTADFNGDGRADFAKRELATGLMWIYLNNGQNPAGFSIASGGRFVARTMLGPDWRVLVGDFTGDGLADYADQYVPLGIMWIHRNIGAPSFAMDTVNWRVVDQVRADANTIVGDFTGDGWCDYADEFTSNGYFFVHRNQNGTVSSPNGGFQPDGQSAGFGDAESPWSWWRLLNAR